MAGSVVTLYFAQMSELRSERHDGWAEAAEARLLAAAIPLAETTGWNETLVARAGKAAGLSPADTTLLLPNGPRDLAALLARRHDALAMAALEGLTPSHLKVRERIRRAVEARVEAAASDEAATRAASRFLAAPFNLPLAGRLLWESADQLWRWAGDVSTDENHYTKRTILAEVLASTLAARFSGGPEAAQKHLARRIDQVMAFETWKAKFCSSCRRSMDGFHASPVSPSWEAWLDMASSTMFTPAVSIPGSTAPTICICSVFRMPKV